MTMAWLLDNWIWILFGAAFVGFHLFGHKMHGGHKSHRRRKEAPPPPSGPLDPEPSDDRFKAPKRSYNDD
jgi:hypothetical protein